MGHDLPEPLLAAQVIVGQSPLTTDRRPKRTPSMAGPLTGYRIIEIAGIGPGPFAAMMLADMGAEVIRVDRAQARRRRGDPAHRRRDVLDRGRRSIGIDLKNPDGVDDAARRWSSRPTR